MTRKHRAVRASFYLSLALPFAAFACGDKFTAGPGDGGEADAEGGIVFGDGGQGHDATSNVDGSADARHDGPRDAGGEHDGTTGDGMADGPSCPPGWLTCSDGGCAQEGPTNCGSCGNDCTMLPHVMNAQCTTGQCSFTCAAGWQNCTSNAGAGCQTNITTQGNCGACNVTCSAGTPVCDGTGCVSGCDAGQTLCTGTCVNTTNNPQDCNGCGNACPAGPTNSQPTCTNSTCGWSCDMGYTQCGSSCFDLSNDPNHCNACGTACTVPAHGQPVCNGGMCTVACDVNYQQCNNSSCILVAPTGGVTVAPSGDTTTSCGSSSLPCATITLAINKAMQLGVSDIFVAEGTYQDQVVLANGIAIHGGWVYSGGGQWTHLCSPNPSATVIQSLPGSDRVVIATFVGSASLDNLEIDNNSTAGTGTSLYGIFASNAQAGQTSLTLTNVDVVVNAGGPGSPGGQGGAGGAPPPSCSSGDGADGGAGPVGSGAMNGSYAVDGFHPAKGSQGSTGFAGDNGSPPPAAPCVPTYPGTSTTNGNCCNQTGIGCVGCSGSATNSICSSQGTNGCGSFGSPGGLGGGGGGASIGIFVWQELVTLDNVSITTSVGGQGNNGGLGVSAQAGSVGATGAKSTQSYFSSCTTTQCSTSCICKPDALLYVSGGSPGGQGGTGGTGGQGGGGAGGDSLCYYEYPMGAVMQNGGSCNTPTTPASGGNNNAAQGRLGLHN